MLKSTNFSVSIIKAEQTIRKLVKQHNKTCWIIFTFLESNNLSQITIFAQDKNKVVSVPQSRVVEYGEKAGESFGALWDCSAQHTLLVPPHQHSHLMSFFVYHDHEALMSSSWRWTQYKHNLCLNTRRHQWGNIRVTFSSVTLKLIFFQNILFVSKYYSIYMKPEKIRRAFNLFYKIYFWKLTSINSICIKFCVPFWSIYYIKYFYFTMFFVGNMQRLGTFCLDRILIYRINITTLGTSKLLSVNKNFFLNCLYVSHALFGYSFLILCASLWV